MPGYLKGRLNWTLQRDKDGHRDYKIRWLVRTDFDDEGPAHVLTAAGMPVIGASWTFGRDFDTWARCWPNATVKPILTKEPGFWWIVEQLFSTKPLQRCQDSQIENPMDEPPRLWGSFVTRSREATKDKDDKPIRNSAHEMIRGAAVEFDHNTPVVNVERNYLTLNLVTVAGMQNKVNDRELWGVAARHVKLNSSVWRRNLYGTCSFYYTLHHEFGIDESEDGFDRKIPDEGTKHLAPGGNKDNPGDFVVYKELAGENTRIFLDGAGNIIGPGEEAFKHDVKYYKEENLLLLGGIPTTL